MASPRRALRVANCSGCTGDDPNALGRVVREGSVDVVTADYLAETNIAWQAVDRRHDPTQGYDKEFLKAFDKETARIVAEKGIKIIHNGGGLNPKGLVSALEEKLASYEIHSLTVSYVEGDDVVDLVDAFKESDELAHLNDSSISFSAIKNEILCANAYLGLGGIATALNQGADIVICGRCCDASPIMGAASWWHGWDASDYDALAGSLLAGHCIECGCYATGGNFSGFKSIPNNQNQGFPVVDLHADGTFEIFLQDGASGLISRNTITAQIGPYYLNPDVIADITNVVIEETETNHVTVRGIRGMMPPPTTKLAVCYNGGYQCETSVFATGLDIPEKLSALRRTFEENIPDKSDYRVLRIDQYGVPEEDAPSQALATCVFRIFAQSQRKELVERVREVLMGYWLGGFPGMHLNMDFRTLVPKPFVIYHPFLIPLDKLNVKVMVRGKTLHVPAPSFNTPFLGQRVKDSDVAYQIDTYGSTRRVPLGTRIYARSGDKGSNANVGLWAESDDEYEWLRSFLSVATFEKLLGNEIKPYISIERFEMPNARCVHFLVKGLLEGGISCTPRLDGLAKSVCEFIRARHVDMPIRFLERGKI